MKIRSVAPPLGTWLRTHYLEIEREKASTCQDPNPRRLEFSLSSCALYCWATIATHGLRTLSKMVTEGPWPTVCQLTDRSSKFPLTLNAFSFSGSPPQLLASLLSSLASSSSSSSSSSLAPIDELSSASDVSTAASDRGLWNMSGYQKLIQI